MLEYEEISSTPAMQIPSCPRQVTLPNTNQSRNNLSAAYPLLIEARYRKAEHSRHAIVCSHPKPRKPREHHQGSCFAEPSLA